jgi:alpha-tubulin suppressor-like RCC1 family protein
MTSFRFWLCSRRIAAHAIARVAVAGALLPSGCGASPGHVAVAAPKAKSVETSKPAPSPAPRIVEVAAGANHACARLRDGTVQCWGANQRGQAGGADLAERRAPGPIEGVERAVELALGSEHGCARLDDGAVRCWGDASRGQLGGGAGEPSAAARAVPGVEQAVAIAAGGAQSCAIVESGKVMCWGDDGATGPRAPTEIEGVSGAVELALGSGHACARLASGALSCWGALGRGASSLASAGRVRAIAAFGERTCALLADGAVACVDAFDRTIARAPAVKGARDLELGFGMACLFTDDGALACWGKNDWGQLGDGTTTARESPTVVFERGVLDFSVGAGHACALVAEAPASEPRVACWGSNASAQLGRDPRLEIETPEPVADLAPLPSVSNDPIAVRRGRSCAIGEEGALSCWGAPIVVEDVAPKNAPDAARAKAAKTGAPVRRDEFGAVASIALGGQGDGAFACARTTEGAVRCAGANDAGQLGSAVRGRGGIGSLRGVTELALGSRHACALLETGHIACWGEHDRGQLGDGSPLPHTRRSRGRRTRKPAPRPMPAPVRVLTTAVEIAAGHDFTCARLRDGTVRCWGDNDRGQLGDGTTTSRSAPFPVLKLSGVARIAAGDAHACALLHDGSVRCWGEDLAGQLGDGAQAPHRNAPVRVEGLEGAVDLALGGATSCAVMADRTVRCWGSAPRPGSALLTTAHTTPTSIAGLSGVRHLAISGEHGCAEVDGGVVKCWGVGDRGQLGLGAPDLFSASPVWLPL